MVKGRRSSGRDGGGFVALPWSVLDSHAYRNLSANARALLLEVARQFRRDNNGRLLLSMNHLSERGWTSADMVAKGKRELLDNKLIFETAIGQRPNKASWYAVTWQTLDNLLGFDKGAALMFERGAYRHVAPRPIVKRDTSAARTARSAQKKLAPSHGVERAPIAPSHGVEHTSLAPSHGAIRSGLGPLSTPSHGHPLDMPSTVAEANTRKTQPNATTALAVVSGDCSVTDIT
jgi:hypothetical protein